MEQQNHDQMAEQYISAVEKQKQSEGYTPDQSFTRGDIEVIVNIWDNPELIPYKDEQQ